ncbi:uncharacterized protein LOC126674519 [Mercurialis annua]|uniref:uncharacterized protein LOC126674519 n=1 Tax=Mercurialis annua TaxID=3986 RepID=UPI00215F5EEC|nr:uncharacterized protein LOC126674519 [Mercurialis annua]
MAAELSLDHAYKIRPKQSSLVNNLFTSTLNTAAKTLVSVSSNVRMEHPDKWRTGDHLRFMKMLMTWMSVWVLRFLMDHFPSVMAFSPHHLLLGRFSPFLRSNNNMNLRLPATSATSSGSSFDLLLQQDDFNGPSVQALGRALTHVLALLNEIPASSRKYQFAMAMADKIMDGNFRDGHVELMEVNRSALSSAFARTLSLLYRSLRNPHSPDDSGGGAWTARVMKVLPMGFYISTCVKGLKYCLKSVLQSVEKGTWQLERRPQLVYEGVVDDLVAEKFAQELLWITERLRAYGAVDEAMVQWSSATGLNSLSFSANPRVQGFIVKISAILLGDLSSHKIEVSGNVKFGLLALWVPLFCHANNGLSYPFLTSYEKMQVERAMDEVISTLAATEQEVILTNWLQDFSVCASDWPNLQQSYDRWCTYTRELAA